MKHFYMYNVGDITSNGWEIVEVVTEPSYIMRKRVRIYEFI